MSVRPSVCPVDRQQQRRAAGLPMSVGAGSRYRSIAAGAAYLSILLQANSKCGQRHVASRRRRLSTELFVGSHVIRVLCAVDSTISSGLNSLAAVCLQDLLRLLCFKDMSEKRATLASKLICMYTSLPSAIFHFLIRRPPPSRIFKNSKSYHSVRSMGLYVLPCRIPSKVIMRSVVSIRPFVSTLTFEPVYQYIPIPMSRLS